MTKRDARISTGVRNLDGVFDGGIPRNSLIAISGAPGSGKTILVQQICFHNATPKDRVLYFGTLSEPTAKILRNLKQFSFFDPEKLKTSVEFVDLGEISKASGITDAVGLITQHLKRVKPAIVVIDSFKVFDDLAKTQRERRAFGYDIAVTLMAWEATTFLIGEFGADDQLTNPAFSIVDGLCVLSQREACGEHQRFLQVTKMRGTNHSREEHPFSISKLGIDVYAPRALLRNKSTSAEVDRCKTRISKLDDLISSGIPWGSSVLLSGTAGTGKTVLSLEFIYRGAQAGEKGIFFSFEETEDRLRAAAIGLGWDLAGEIERGMIEIVFIPQPEIRVEADLLMMRERVAAFGAKRIVIDSISVFLHKIADPELCREKIYHICSIVQNADAVGIFPTDIPYGATQISRFGVEETVVDGVILLRSIEEGLERQRYIEIYKLRDSAHLKGRHNMLIAKGGISVFPRYGLDPPDLPKVPSRSTDLTQRLPSGIPGLDPFIGGGVLARSVTLVSGSSGIGKSMMAVQFLLAGVDRGEAGLYVSLEEGPEQMIAAAASLGLPLRDAVDRKLIDILYVSRENIPIGEFFTVLADRLTASKAKRVVIDAITHMVNERFGFDELRHVLYKLSVRFKALDVTSLFTLEASSLYANELATERGLSPIADNLLILRYRETKGRLVSVLTVLKTRGSAHDHRTHQLSIGPGGLRVEPGEPEAGGTLPHLEVAR